MDKFQIHNVSEEVIASAAPTASRSEHTRNIMTLVMGLASARVGMSVGGTITNACIIVNKFRDHTLNSDIIEPVWESVRKAAHFENPELKELFNQLKPYIGASFKGVAIGGILFAVPAAVVGWQRGDRVEHIKDIVCKPRDTFHRLSISEAHFQEEYSQPHNYVSCQQAQHSKLINDVNVAVNM